MKELLLKKFFILQLVLRSVSALLSLSSAIVMVVDKQTSDFAGYDLVATFTMAPALKFFVADMIIMLLTTSAATAGTTIAFLAKDGNSKIGWAEVCSYFHKFCNRAVISYIFSFAALALFLTSTLFHVFFACKIKGKEQQQKLQQSSRV